MGCRAGLKATGKRKGKIEKNRGLCIHRRGSKETVAEEKRKVEEEAKREKPRRKGKAKEMK